MIKSDNSENLPQVVKKNEFDLMLKFVRLGMWRTTNLSKACNVDMDTITAWKKRPETIIAYQEAVEKIIKKRYNISDPDKLMRELDLESDLSPSSLTQNNIYLGLNDEQLDKLIESKVRQTGISLPAGRETASDAEQSDEVR